MSEQLTFPVTYALIALTAMTSLIGFGNPAFTQQNILWVRRVRENAEWYRLLSSGLLHVNGLHLFLNMYGLWLFGPVVERSLGRIEFLTVYILALAGGSLWAVIWNRHNPEYRAAGASGAISGIIMAFCLTDPFAVLLLFFIIPIWGIVFAFLFILLSWRLSHRAGRVIGHEAHLGGALAGIIAALLVKPELWPHFTGLILQRIG